MEKIIWVLVDDRAGNTSQVLGVAEALALPFITKNIRYNHLGRLSNIIKGRTLLGLTTESKQEISPPWPDIVISIASRMESTALYIKKKNPKTKLVHIQKPRLPIHNFDIVAVPEHDFLGKGKSKAAPANVLMTLGAPNRITPQVLAVGKEKWEAEFAHLNHPRIAVLVGGSTNKAEYTMEHAMELASQANDLCTKSGGSLLVTTSRRTPEEIVLFLEQELQSPKYFYTPNKGGNNPYAGLLACSDIIIASGDSVSMCSEACSTGKPVYIFSPPALTVPKYRYFQERLVSGGYAVMLGDKWRGDYIPLNDAKIIAEKIKLILDC
jgi:mitochondrial fission protein ELM1